MTMEDRFTINFLGVRVDALDSVSICDKIIKLALDGRQSRVMYVNTDCMLISLKDDAYRKILNGADLVYPDGVGVVLGARLWGKHLPGRSTAADFFPGFCREFAKHKLRLYLLGGKEGIAEQAAARVLKLAPDLEIVGIHHGYFKREETGQIIEAINAAKPHILVIGFGVPFQENWIEENATRIQANVIWGVGGLFDFLSGRTRRGPQWLLDHGFEWLCRLISEPRRLWRRYLIGNTKYILYLLWYRFISQRLQ